MRIFILVLLITGLCRSLVAQEEPVDAVYVDPPSQTHLTRWYMLGPLPVMDIVGHLKASGKYEDEEMENEPFVYRADDQEWLGWKHYHQVIQKSILLDNQADAAIQDVEGKSFTLGGKEYVWKFVDHPHRRINLDDIYDRRENAVVYGYTELELSSPKTAYLFFRSDDSMKVFLNGEEIYSFIGGRSIGQDVDSVKVNLREGINRLLVKVIDFHLDWGFSVQLRDEDDLPLEMVIENSMDKFSGVVSEDASAIWIPVSVFLACLVFLIGVFLVVAKMYGGGEKLN